MTRHLGDAVIEHLRAIADLPDLGGTKFEMVRRLASGGMGTVYVVRDIILDREVALKVLTLPDAQGDLGERFRRESKILAALEHPNIVPIHDAGTLADGRGYYVMKLVRGEGLDRWLTSAAPTQHDILRMFSRICDAVAFAHANGVVHRDLKPANIMIGSFGEALVMDWGVAKVLADGHGADGRALQASIRDTGTATVAGTIIGTPMFMSPEQARGEDADARSDVYALGAILLRLLGGRDQKLPRRLAAICRKAAAEDAAHRYPDARELAEDVDKFLAGLPVRAHKESVIERLQRVVLRHKAVILLIAAYLAMRLIVVFTAGR